MSNQSKTVQSNQTGIHPDLEQTVRKHQSSLFGKPYTAHSLEAFDVAKRLYLKNSENFILDSGCGVGESTLHIAERYPDSFVLGIDQSKSRIERQSYHLPKNAQLLRTDCIDFWRLAAESNWLLKKHFILYPNPWPKKKHLLRRWHGHPVFPTLFTLGGELELRTNWKLYAEEFVMAVNTLHYESTAAELFNADKAMTPFERKYRDAGQHLYRVTVNSRR